MASFADICTGDTTNCSCGGVCPYGNPWPEERAVTVGRKKRKRRRGAGSAVKVRSHLRSPRGPNRGKKKVRVDPYGRGNGAKKRKRGRKKR